MSDAWALFWSLGCGYLFHCDGVGEAGVLDEVDRLSIRSCGHVGEGGGYDPLQSIYILTTT